ncbi:SDR family oxidoreductase [Actinomyces howellii]|nr:NAD(P)H-binding protein [Actinomyces howellii]
MASASTPRPGAETEDRRLTVRTLTVFGASGQTGRALIAQLLARGVQVRAVTRAQSMASFPPAVDVAHGDLADPDTLVEALRGADAVYHIAPAFSPHEVAFGRNVIAAATTAGAHRVVYHSVMRSMTPSMPHHWRKWMVEEPLRSAQLDWTILRPAMYMQTPIASSMPHAPPWRLDCPHGACSPRSMSRMSRMPLPLCCWPLATRGGITSWPGPKS